MTKHRRPKEFQRACSSCVHPLPLFSTEREALYGQHQISPGHNFSLTMLPVVSETPGCVSRPMGRPNDDSQSTTGCLECVGDVGGYCLFDGTLISTQATLSMRPRMACQHQPGPCGWLIRRGDPPAQSALPRLRFSFISTFRFHVVSVRPLFPIIHRLPLVHLATEDKSCSSIFVAFTLSSQSRILLLPHPLLSPKLQPYYRAHPHTQRCYTISPPWAVASRRGTSRWWKSTIPAISPVVAGVLRRMRSFSVFFLWLFTLSRSSSSFSPSLE